MSPDDLHQARAEACFDVTRRLVADLRRDREDVWCRLAGMNRVDLEAVTVMALAMVRPGVVDRWWDRDVDVTPEQLHRRDVLIGKAS